MKTKSLYLFFLLIIMVSAPSFAQGNTDLIKKDSIENKNDSTIKKKDSVALVPVKPNVSYVKSFWVDSKAIVASPFHWKHWEWIAAGGVATVTVILFTQDAKIQTFAQRNRTSKTNTYLTYILDPWGSGLFSLPTLGIFYGYGAIWKNDKAKETSLKGFEAFILTGAMVQIIKELSQRHRPYSNTPSDPWIWDGPYHLIPNASFPSGHSAGAFAVATVISSSYYKTIWVPIVCFTLASLTAMGRVVENNHWASDAFVGSVIGFAIGRLVYHGSYRRLQILPTTTVGQGVTIIYHL